MRRGSFGAKVCDDGHDSSFGSFCQYRKYRHGDMIQKECAAPTALACARPATTQAFRPGLNFTAPTALMLGRIFRAETKRCQRSAENVAATEISGWVCRWRGGGGGRR